MASFRRVNTQMYLRDDGTFVPRGSPTGDSRELELWLNDPLNIVDDVPPLAVDPSLDVETAIRQLFTALTEKGALSAGDVPEISSKPVKGTKP